MNDKIDIKEGDVFKFRFNQEYLDKFPLSDPYHCFDGQLVVVTKSDGNLILEDTYWNGNRKKFKLDQLELNGTLTFVCNLNDVDECSESDVRYYNDNDIIDLSYQHGCYKRFVKRRGSKRSKEVMLNFI